MTTRYSKVSNALLETLIGTPKYTSLEAAKLADVAIEDALQFWRALGLAQVSPTTRVFTDKDVVMLRASREILEREDADAEVLLQIARASGQAFARMTAVQVVPVATEILGAMRSSEYTDTEAVDDVVGLSDALLTRVEPFVSYAWRRHLVAAVLQLAASGAEHIADERTLTVGFADMVGFTAVSQELSAKQIAHTVASFERLAYEQISSQGGKVIKMIGDEVLFTTDDAETAAEISLRLVESCTADEVLPDVRIGIAAGPTLVWQGDVFGPTVNLASRLVNIARPATVLVSEGLGEDLVEVDGMALRSIPRVNLKGIGRTRPRVLRRQAS